MGVGLGASHRGAHLEPRGICTETESLSRKLVYVARRFSRVYHRSRQLFLDHVLKARIEIFEHLLGRIAEIVEIKCFVGSKHVASRMLSREHPGDKIAAFNEIRGVFVDLGGLFKYLHYLREEPLAGGPSAETLEYLGGEFFCRLVESVSLGLSRVMLPELDVGMGIVLESLVKAKGSAVRLYGDEGAGGEVYSDSDYLILGNSRFAYYLRYGPAERLEIVCGMLKREGIWVNAICPGFIRSRITDRNTCPMPFFMEADKAAKIMLSRVDRNVGLIAFPWPMRLGVWLMSALPWRLSEFISCLLPEKTASGKCKGHGDGDIAF